MSIWHLRRFLAMSWEERRLRAARLFRNLRDRRAFARGGWRAVLGDPPPPDRFLAARFREPWLVTPEFLHARAADLPPAWRDRALGEAREICAGTYRWLGRTVQLGTRPEWRREAVSGVTFPPAYWSTLATASVSGAFDLKHLWEPNLHTAFVTLAKAALLEPAGPFRSHLHTLWQDWMEQNPPLAGPNYLAPVETGIRLVNWATALRFLEAAEPVDASFQQALWEHVAAQRASIAANLSRGSSANNHLLGELASLVLADSAFAGLAPAEATAKYREELQREVLLQFHEDGVNREQALHYHGFSLEFAGLAELADRAGGRAWPERVVHRLRQAVDYLHAAHDREGVPFLYGDSDDSEVLPLAEGPRRPTQCVVALGRAAWDNAFASDERTHWLLGPAHEPGAPSPDRTERQVFARGGHAFLRRGAIEAHVNGGDLGYLSICAHGHADVGSIEVRVRGHAVIVDPGTHSYRGGNPWRDALVSHRAHAGIQVNGREPAERGGPFLWTRSYRARLSDTDEVIQVTHDGYRGDRIETRRDVFWDAEGALTVRDTVQGAGSAEVRLCWPLGPGQAEITGGAVRFRSGPVEARLEVDGLGTPALVEGSLEQPGSPVYSDGYDKLTPITACVWEDQVMLPLTVVTRIHIPTEGRVQAPRGR